MALVTGDLSEKTQVRFRIAALMGGAATLIATTAGVAIYSTNIGNGLTELKAGQAAQAKALEKLAERFEELRLASDRENWRLRDQALYMGVFEQLNPEIKVPEVPPR